MRSFTLSTILVAALSVVPAAWAAFASPLSSASPADGIIIEVTRHVTCDRKTKANDVISMAYSLSLADGTKVESTKPGETFTFTLGVGEVIQGWDMGLTDMCIGEKRKLTIPPEYGYGLDAVGPIPANSTLIFDTTLVDIQGVTNTGKPLVTRVPA
ncbi:Peptidyl-prolyl cis-trans isomerase fpr2 [Sporothrix eucalyptigena]|uniref:peptidylprolyl isomerase n=1 Tax=Sporothrix eucalyptigena TaxID=1812306 RepID=A0ABP0CID6_9PEZI